jgi:hypothetical protein
MAKKLTQEQVEQWIAANGGPGAVQYAVEQKSVKNPAYDPYDDTKGPQYTTIPVETWKNSKTGAVLSARRGDDGSFEEWESATADPNKNQNDDTPDKRNAAELQRQRERNAALPAAQDPAYETDEERRKRGDARIAQQRQQGIDADAAAARNAPRPVATNTTEPYIVQAGPNGQITTTPNPNYQGPKPERSVVKGADGRSYVVTLDKDGNATAKPVEGLPQEGKTPYPKDLPPFTYDWQAPAGDGGLIAYASAVRARPDLTDAQKAEIIKDAHAAATTTISRAQSAINAQENTRANETTQRGQDVSLATNRRSASSADFGNALTASQAATKYSEGPDAASVLPYYLAMAHAAAQGGGGMVNPPQVGSGPAIQQAGQMGLPGQGVPSLGSIMAGQGAPGFTPGPPSPIGAVTNGVTATNAAAINPTGANVQAANDATMAGSNAAFGALGVPPQNPAQNAALQGASLGPIGPANLFPAPAQPQAYQPTGAGAMLMQRAGGYDPTGVNRLLAEAGIPPEILTMMGGVG